MASLKPVVKKDKSHINAKGESRILILVVHKGKNVYLRTDFSTNPKHMLASGKIRSTHPNATELNKKLGLIVDGYQSKILKLKTSLNNIDIHQLKEILARENSLSEDFYTFADKKIEEIRQRSKKTADTYKHSVNKLQKVAPGFLPFSSIDKKLLEKFTAFYLKDGCSLNTISVHMRSIRAIFNDAIEFYNHDGLDPVIVNYPFRYFRIKTEETRKRSITSNLIRKTKMLDLSDPGEILARDMFMLTFYLIGINIKDLFYAQPPKNGYLIFNRAKTHKKYQIQIHHEAESIINRYKGKSYLLYFAERMKDHTSLMKMINGKDWKERRSGKDMLTGLKSITKKLGLEENLTTYWARHSWATIARNELGISKDDIAQCLGHSDPSRKTTEIYLNENQELVDRTNRKVIDFIKIL
jgi:site-specific recombinase XerD